MTEKMENEYTPDYVSPPGETLQEVLENIGMSQAELAERTGRPHKTINEIIRGVTAITPETALQLESVLGIPASFWNNWEKHYQESLARIKEMERLEGETEWVENFPYVKMSNLGWVEKTRDKIQKLKNLLSFFGVVSAASWETVWDGISVAYRKSSSLKSKKWALAAWLRQGEILGQNISCNIYDSHAFSQSLKKLRGLTLEDTDVFIPKLTEICAGCGVAVVFVPEVTGTHAFGATRWMTPTKALIQLSLRYKTDDHLWFTFFHECRHVLQERKRTIFIESDNNDSTYENDANRFASEFLIPSAELYRFAESGPLTRNRIVMFADQLGIAPGIVVERLQHDGIIPFVNHNGLKRRFKWSED